MRTYRNLAHRLARPATGRGRIQKAARRVLLLLDGEATTRDVVDWGYCRKVQRGERIEKADYRHRRLLRARRERPRHRAAEQRDELAPVQLIELHHKCQPEARRSNL
jgi:hypothetical protein